MSYPFQERLKDMDETSWKLKLMAVAGEVPVSEMCRQIVDRVFDLVDQTKIKEAEKKLGRRKTC